MIRHFTLCAMLLTGTGALTAEEKPANPTEAAPVTASSPQQNLTAENKPAKIERLKTEQWCWTHDLPKNMCATCNRKLIPALKKSKDWCTEHAIAESLCVKCDPKAKDSLDAQRPADKPKDTKE